MSGAKGDYGMEAQAAKGDAMRDERKGEEAIARGKASDNAWTVLERARREAWDRNDACVAGLVSEQNNPDRNARVDAIVLAVNTIAEAREALEEAADRLCFLIPIGDSRTAKVIDKARAVLARMEAGK